MKKVIFSLLITSLLVSCDTKSVYNDPIPIHQSYTIRSEHLNEDRVINVWIPPGYEVSSNSYPVLYMPDGGIREDFPHIANTLGFLIEQKKIEPIILVGIENTERGRDLTGASTSEYDEQFCPVTDGAKNFRAFISEELIPEIENKYRTTDNRGIIGESLAGLFVIESFFKDPSLFDFYIAMDPSLWWDNHYLVANANSLLSDFPSDSVTLWFAGSQAEDISIHTNELASILENYSPPLVRWKYVDYPEEKHSSIFRASKESALVWALNP